MDQDTEKTIVIFRIWKHEGSVLALFPEEDWNPLTGSCTSYQHIGQHGAAGYYHCIAATRPAKPKEYESLQRELEGLGYNLKIQSRFVRHRRQRIS
jgi:hypothetical protein